jgi:hypothetical protein
MNKHTACALYLSFLTLPALAQTIDPAAPAAPEATAVLEAAPSTVVVEGRRPGPGVWKVSKDGHVMWVFGLYSPLPKKMEWDASRVERLVAQSQAVLLPPSAEAHLGFWSGLKLLPQLPRLVGIRDNPDGATLHDVLPADIYAHWTVLKAKYIGEDKDVERQRPIFVAQRLIDAGYDKSGLSKGGEVRGKIMEIAKQNKVKLIQTGIEIPLDNVGHAITEFKQTRLNDAACLGTTLDYLEQDLDAMRVRADAWANGNLVDIQKLDYETRESACDDALLGSSVAKSNEAFHSMRDRMRASWLQAAEKALADNTTTFALLQMKDVFDKKGYLAVLQARGYTVESPK